MNESGGTESEVIEEFRSVNDTEYSRTDTKIFKLLHGSFQYSQGAQESQRLMFKWFAGKGYLDKLEIPKEPPKAILNMHPPRKHTDKILGMKSILGIDNSEFYQNTVEREWKQLHNAKNDHEVSNLNTLAERILGMILLQEIRFQKKGRPNRTTKDDPYFSILRQHAILGEATSTAEFDSLFSELTLKMEEKLKESNDEGITQYAELEKNQLFELPISSRVFLLKHLWEKNHPGEKFFPDTQAA